jgi:hypothetical protein
VRRRQYRQIAELCAAPGMDEVPVEAWIEVGRQQAITATAGRAETQGIAVSDRGRIPASVIEQCQAATKRS